MTTYRPLNSWATFGETVAGVRIYVAQIDKHTYDGNLAQLRKGFREDEIVMQDTVDVCRKWVRAKWDRALAIQAGAKS